MSNKITITAVSIICLVTMLCASYSPIGPKDANGQQVLPGGRAAHIRSFWIQLNPYEEKVIIESVEGPHGLIITDFAVPVCGSSTRFYLSENDGSGPRIIGDFNLTATLTLSLHSGVPVAAGSELRIMNTTDSSTYVTLCGYTY